MSDKDILGILLTSTPEKPKDIKKEDIRRLIRLIEQALKTTSSILNDGRQEQTICR